MGKTKFAGAIAKYVHGKRGCTFFNVSASELLSTWHSESEKALLTLFSRAEQETCSIIFLDEVRMYVYEQCLLSE
jgi:vacuolar protein-sorting-associated protein 4